MPKIASGFPSLRLHKATGQVLVTLNGCDHYLGKYGGPASRLEYERLISIWLANGRRLPQTKAPITIAELMAAHLKWAKEYYRRSSHKDSQILSIKALLRVVRPDFGRLGASCHVEFELDGPLDSNNSARFQSAVARAYAACREAVERELAGRAQSVNDSTGEATSNSATNSAPTVHADSSGTSQPSRWPFASRPCSE